MGTHGAERKGMAKMTKQRMIRSVLILAAGMGVLALAACSWQRPLQRVREDAKRHMDAGRYDAAVTDLDEYVTRKPEDHAARFDLGKALISAGQPKPAIKQMQVASDVQPLNDAYADGVAEAMLAAGERDELTAYLNKLALERGRVGDFTRLGKFSARLGNVDEAKTALITAARLDRGRSLGPQLDLAEFYETIGDRANWVKRLRMAYFIDPTSSKVMDAIQRAKEIPGPSFAVVPQEVTQGP